MPLSSALSSIGDFPAGGRQAKKRKNITHENKKNSDHDCVSILDYPCRDLVRIASGQRTDR